MNWNPTLDTSVVLFEWDQSCTKGPQGLMGRIDLVE